jgi:glycosyltransferase involved in cell wall biosynthesis
MKIINAMFAKGLGGIEQAFIDYTNALKLAGHEVICITQPDAKVNLPLSEIEGIKHYKVSNAGQWDLFAKSILFILAKKHKADAIIAHGSRAIALLKWANSAHCPLIGVAHNYSSKKFRKISAAFTVTDDLKHNLENNTRLKSNMIFTIPNMISIPQNVEFVPARKKIIIGTAARHVKKKALDVLIKTAVKLRSEGVDFEIVIGGVGKETEKLQKMRDRLGLNEYVRFIGWVHNKEQFYSNIDIFALPSEHEPFGIVVLEAWAHKKPLVTTLSEGPKALVTDEVNALTCPIGDAEAMAEKLLQLINHPQKARELAENGYITVKENFNLNIVSQKLSTALEVIKNQVK